jgi:hypothetical protein
MFYEAGLIEFESVIKKRYDEWYKRDYVVIREIEVEN